MTHVQFSFQLPEKDKYFLKRILAFENNIDSI